MRAIAAVAALVLIFKFGICDFGESSFKKIESSVSGGLSAPAKNILVKYFNSEGEVNVFAPESGFLVSSVNKTEAILYYIGPIFSAASNSLKIETSLNVVGKVGQIEYDFRKIKRILDSARRPKLDIGNGGLAATGIVNVEADHDQPGFRVFDNSVYAAQNDTRAMAGNKFFVSEINAFPCQSCLIRSRARRASSFPPEENGRNTQYGGKERNPVFGWIPHYSAVGGLLLGNCINFFGGWLYYNDNRLGRTRRKRIGCLVIFIGILVVFGGYLLCAATGGGY